MTEAHQDLSTRRSPRRNRRAESAAGAPSGAQSATGFIEIPVAEAGPSDITPRTGVASQTDRPDPVSDAAAAESPDGAVPQPRTRREARRLRELGLLPDAVENPSVNTSGTATRHAETLLSSPTPSDRAVDPAEDEERAAVAQEAAELAELMAAADHSDPHTVDPEIQRRQQALAERAARLNASGAGPSSGTDAEQPAADLPSRWTAAESTPPVDAAAAHGLDSLAASEATSRERTLLLIAAAVLAIGLIALVVGLIMIAT